MSTGDVLFCEGQPLGQCVLQRNRPDIDCLNILFAPSAFALILPIKPVIATSSGHEVHAINLKCVVNLLDCCSYLTQAPGESHFPALWIFPRLLLDSTSSRWASFNFCFWLLVKPQLSLHAQLLLTAKGSFQAAATPPQSTS